MPQNTGERPSWLNRLLLGEKHAVLWTALGVIVAVLAIIIGYRVPWQIQSHVEASNTSKITYAVSILPNPPPGESLDTTTYWGSVIQIWNAGPATAKTVVLHIHAPSPDVFLHSPPKLMSSPPAAEVQINEREPRGIYEVVLRNFSPGEFCAVRMAYRAEGSLAQKVRNDWSKDGLSSSTFARNFISQFWFSGENLRAENLGVLDVQQTFPLK